jgi:hypothetical protein
MSSKVEAVEVYFDPEKPGYRRLLAFFFQIPGGYKSQFIRPGWTPPVRSAGLPKGDDDPSMP